MTRRTDHGELLSPVPGRSLVSTRRAARTGVSATGPALAPPRCRCNRDRMEVSSGSGTWPLGRWRGSRGLPRGGTMGALTHVHRRIPRSSGSSLHRSWCSGGNCSCLGADGRRLVLLGRRLRGGSGCGSMFPPRRRVRQPLPWTNRESWGK